MPDSILVFTQNLKLKSLEKCMPFLNKGSNTIFVTTQFLFENERKYLSSLFSNCVFKTFVDFLTDKNMAYCDKKLMYRKKWSILIMRKE